jgi:hypothetical protein
MSHQIVDELLSYIFGDATDFFAAQVADWALSSKRFRTFALTYRDKIRKKIRGTRDPEGLRDLQFELATAYFLLQEQQFTVEYEKFGTGKQRTPDFSVTYRTNTIFNVEVKRLRFASQESEADTQPAVAVSPAGLPTAQLDADQPPPPEAESTGAYAYEARESGKLTNTVCNKIGQMPQGMINILVIAGDGIGISDIDVVHTMKHLKRRAEHKDDVFFARRGCVSARDFLKQYQRLSSILLRGPGGQALLWTNAQAKYPVPADIRAILQREEHRIP